MRVFAALLMLLSLFSSGFAASIEEKKAQSIQKREGSSSASDQLLQKVNHDLLDLRAQLELSYLKASELYNKEAHAEEYSILLSQVSALKAQMLAIEEKWREASVSDAKGEEEGYALWDQEETTLGQLIMEYGAMDYLYIVPPEMAALKLNMHSNIPIPRESWNEVLEIILSHNGIGVKKLNPYAKQLFLLKQDPSSIKNIAANPSDLLRIAPHSRVFYLLSPPVEQAKSVFQFLEKFADIKQSFVYQIGGKIAIVSSKEEVERMLSLYNTVWDGNKGKVSRVVPIGKMGVKEMEKILSSFFSDSLDRTRNPFGKIEGDGLTVHTLNQGRALILVGSQAVVDRAEKIIKETEDQLQDPSEMTVFLYSCRHSDPTELAKVLDKVYTSLLYAAPEGESDSYEINYALQGPGVRPPDGYAPNPPALANPPPPARPSIVSHLEYEQGGSDHFIADPKTGTILMVIRRDTLPKIKELLRKLDIPKKMVQIEVLLFEKRLNTNNSFGLNLLKLGTKSNHVKYTSANAPVGRGVLDFFFSGKSSKHFPSFDVAYNFLLSQEDIQLNAAPSLITVNQTPATIAITEEISINNGAAPIDTNKGIAFEKSFTRAQYGITIVLTPTVHLPDNEEEAEEGKGFVTLQTDITFDTTKPSQDDRPLVDKRHIQNEVRVVDGQTVILGGLRRKSSLDTEEKLPFFGDLPGIGMLFGSTKLIDHSTEMFFFITPKIVQDPKEELDLIRAEELKKRAGDIPEFLEKVVEARDKEKRKFFKESLKTFFTTKR
ncbi:MAG: type II secretion system protein GspD [Chlamydiales bacterium]|nr:type II secretion system protein GspD [Chlamydiales bacterium]